MCPPVDNLNMISISLCRTTETSIIGKIQSCFESKRNDRICWFMCNFWKPNKTFTANSQWKKLMPLYPHRHTILQFFFCKKKGRKKWFNEKTFTFYMYLICEIIHDGIIISYITYFWERKLIASKAF